MGGLDEGEEEVEDRVGVEEPIEVGGAVCIVKGGGGGVLGTFSTGIEEADDGVAGVAALALKSCKASRL